MTEIGTVHQDQTGPKGQYIRTKLTHRASTRRLNWPEGPVNQEQTGPSFSGFEFRSQVSSCFGSSNVRTKLAQYDRTKLVPVHLALRCTGLSGQFSPDVRIAKTRGNPRSKLETRNLNSKVEIETRKRNRKA